MKREESGCVQCGLPCIGYGCPYYKVTVTYCDDCGDDNAEYKIDGQDYCYKCAIKLMNEEFDNMSVEDKIKFAKDTFNDLDFYDKAEVLKIEIKNMGD